MKIHKKFAEIFDVEILAADFSRSKSRRLRNVNSLGNHTVNALHSFSVVFVDFDRENINTQEFRQNISNRARSNVYRGGAAVQNILGFVCNLDQSGWHLVQFPDINRGPDQIY